MKDNLDSNLDDFISTTWEDIKTKAMAGEFGDDENRMLEAIIDGMREDFGWHPAQRLIKVFKLMYGYYETNSPFKRIEILAEMFSALEGKPFMARKLHGGSQSDWQYCICPADMEDSLPYIEAVYFRTGTFYEICVRKCSSAKEYVEHCRKGECYTDYTNAYLDDDVRQWAGESQYLNCPAALVHIATPEEAEEIKEELGY